MPRDELVDETAQNGGPFGLPVSQRAWYGLLVLGFVISFLLMGLVYEVTQATLLGPVSVPETVGVVFFAVWGFVVIGPFTPFSIRGEASE